ncbi:hypothetical protein Glove_468g7 [Diversispora epigaea]|uniref:Uncharacterized protein n=1 Tax=Diversispora epigaea TaxID=1348612 RepID=A0A397GQF6_9GLOM|nr:hypothetical protein Glove_468g7 [Diversispora epigaea]
MLLYNLSDNENNESNELINDLKEYRDDDIELIDDLEEYRDDDNELIDNREDNEDLNVDFKIILHASIVTVNNVNVESENEHEKVFEENNLFITLELEEKNKNYEGVKLEDQIDIEILTSQKLKKSVENRIINF